MKALFLLLALIVSTASFAEDATKEKEKSEEKKDKTEKLMPPGPGEGGSTVGNGAPKTPPKKDK